MTDRIPASAGSARRLAGAPRRRSRLWIGAGVAMALSALVGASCGGDPAAGGPEPGVPTNDARHLDAPYVVMVSFDGMRFDYVDYPTAPNFRRVATAGVRAERMIPVFPTKTFPNHYSIATGMYAERHGLVGNNFWAPDKGAAYSISNRAVVEDGSWYRGEPIWVTAERQGMVAASYFWVGSEADVGGVRPSHWHRYDGSVPNDTRVDAVLAWLALPADQRPHMITLYFSDLDDTGHRYGPESPELEEALASVDGSLGRLLDGIAALPHGRDVYVVLVSDHGMLAAPAAKAQPLDLARFPGVRLLEAGPYASLWIDQGGAERAPGLRDSIAAVLPNAEVWLRADVPERFHYRADPRIGDIVALAEPEYTIARMEWLPARDGYTHGWDNQLLEMGGIFLAVGPRIRPGQSLPPFEAVHVYPFLAHVLGLPPASGVDGRLEVLRPVLGG